MMRLSTDRSFPEVGRKDVLLPHSLCQGQGQFLLNFLFHFHYQMTFKAFKKFHQLQTTDNYNSNANLPRLFVYKIILKSWKNYFKYQQKKEKSLILACLVFDSVSETPFGRTMTVSSDTTAPSYTSGSLWSIAMLCMVGSKTSLR